MSFSMQLFFRSPLDWSVWDGMENFFIDETGSGRMAWPYQTCIRDQQVGQRPFVFVKTHAYGNKGEYDQKYGATCRVIKCVRARAIFSREIHGNLIGFASRVTLRCAVSFRKLPHKDFRRRRRRRQFPVMFSLIWPPPARLGTAKSEIETGNVASSNLNLNRVVYVLDIIPFPNTVIYKLCTYVLFSPLTSLSSKASATSLILMFNHFRYFWSVCIALLLFTLF